MKDIIALMFESNFEVILLSVSLSLTAFLFYYMKFCAAYKGKKLSSLWYICSVISPFIAGFAFYLYSKKIWGTDNEQEKKDEKTERKAKVLEIGFWVLRVVSTCIVILNTLSLAFDVIDMFEEKALSQIGFESESEVVYYDKNTNEYSDADSVLLYDRQGNNYVRVAVQTPENKNKVEIFFVGTNEEKYPIDNCFVDEDGYFVYDEESSVPKDIITRIKYIFGGSYYDYPYTDTEGEKLYYAKSASYDKKGELILEHNDPTLFPSSQ